MLHLGLISTKLAIQLVKNGHTEDGNDYKSEVRSSRGRARLAA